MDHDNPDSTEPVDETSSAANPEASAPSSQTFRERLVDHWLIAAIFLLIVFVVTAVVLNAFLPEESKHTQGIRPVFVGIPLILAAVILLAIIGKSIGALKARRKDKSLKQTESSEERPHVGLEWAEAHDARRAAEDASMASVVAEAGTAPHRYTTAECMAAYDAIEIDGVASGSPVAAPSPTTAVAATPTPDSLPSVATTPAPVAAVPDVVEAELATDIPPMPENDGSDEATEAIIQWHMRYTDLSPSKIFELVNK